jgi:hypothetical protein
VTASHTAPPPPPPPPPSPEPAPPPPPSVPFNACANSCLGLAEGETRCRDGGYGSFFPTHCPYSAQCAQCGFRENTRDFANDDSCAHANNGVCEDGDFGSSFFTNEDGEVTHLCGLGTDWYAFYLIEQTPHADLDTKPSGPTRHQMTIFSFWQDRLRRNAPDAVHRRRRLHGPDQFFFAVPAASAAARPA